MLGHLGLNVPDLVGAKRYYDALMELVGFEAFVEHDDEFAYRPAGGKRGTFLFFYRAEDPAPYARQRTGLQHLAFMVQSRQAVRTVHRRVVQLGSTVLYEPQEFPQYPPPYFATFWLDPFGLMIEAVCHHDRDDT